jgi:hypothetical protein
VRRLALLAVVLIASPAAAQVTVSGGVTWSGGYAIGDATASLRSNALGTTTPAFTWFDVSSEMTAAAGVEARVGFNVHPRLTLEAGGAFSRPRVAFAVTHDSEAGAQSLAGESLQQYIIDGGVVWHWPIAALPKLVPFVAGGAGYLRQLHEERTLVETGQVYYVGGGTRYWLRGRPDRSGGLGVRGDLRMMRRVSGIDFEDRRRTYLNLSLQAFIAF